MIDQFQGLNIYNAKTITMAGIKIDGIEIAKNVKDRVRKAADELKKQGINPCLATILVGDNQASATYVRNKHKACEEVGITTKDFKLAANTTQSELNKIIIDLNNDKSVHGILVQLPLPSQLDEFATTSRISPLKDVDGLTPHNAGLLAMKKAALVACTPSGVMEMFDYHNIALEGKTVVLINRSNLVGKPLYHLLLARDATVITCHSKTKNIKELCQMADIIITAVGDRNKFTLTQDMIKKDAVVIDVAISRYEEKLSGDVDYEQIIQKASYATPVPGGVGPMTVAMLLKNTITAASLSSQIER
ncbi:Bifunctional protein FolD (Includes: Methylenetetrahydrofolate dehydrogenase; Methenyltetrahydrofolate cyclohydrolase) [metagenome]